MLYHCVTRLPNKIMVFEEPMDLIDLKNVSSISKNTNTITFTDHIHEYSFNLTKSTLYKRFKMNVPIIEFSVSIIEHPYIALNSINNNYVKNNRVAESVAEIDFEHSIPSELVYTSKEDCVILPLFSDRGNGRNVPERSGLNQWNAQGRPRDHNEVYIPIPKWIHRVFPNFFPTKDQSFHLIVPSGAMLHAKVCQQDSKALMTNPNKDLGQWLLREVMDLDERELLTYGMLERLNIDSVIITKRNENSYTIDFVELGTYDTFKVQFDI